MSEPATIHIPLLGEGTKVWRPVQAERLAPDLYLVRGPVPDDEEWAFPPGSVVRCVASDLSGHGGHPQTCQVAVARVENDEVAS
jgi:hypothetical protein